MKNAKILPAKGLKKYARRTRCGTSNIFERQAKDGRKPRE